jgi:hypothetical protein
MSAWYCVNDSKITWAPVGKYVTKKGEVKVRFKRIGVRVDMADGSWWFYSFVHNTWTKHWPLTRKMDRLGRPAIEAGKPVFLPERRDRYTVEGLRKEWLARKPELVSALENAVNSIGEPNEE